MKYLLIIIALVIIMLIGDWAMNNDEVTACIKLQNQKAEYRMNFTATDWQKAMCLKRGITL
jgi:hypothetical protein